jgi:hypothetical protein
MDGLVRDESINTLDNFLEKLDLIFPSAAAGKKWKHRDESEGLQIGRRAPMGKRAWLPRKRRRASLCQKHIPETWGLWFGAPS